MELVEMTVTLGSMPKTFVDWVQQELDNRGWSQSEAARRGGISSQIISSVLSGASKPGLEFCRGIHRAFGMPLEDVLRLAGILPPASAREAGVTSLIARLDEMDPATRRETVDLIGGILDYWERRREEIEGKRPAARRRANSRADRLAQFRAAFDALPDDERRDFLSEALQEFDRGGDQTAGLEP